LAQFRQAFEEFEAMSDVEKGIVRSYWDTTDTGDTPKPLHLTPPATADDSGQAKQDSTPSKLKQAITSTANAAGLTAALSVGAAGAILMKAASFIGNVSELVENYQKSIKPYHCGPKETPEEVTEAIDHIRDLEEFSAELEEKPKPAEEAEDTTLIDEKIQEIVPTDYFTESPTQTALTIEEGQVIQAFLHPTEALPPTVKSVQEVSTPDPRTPTERLDDIITRSPEVRDIYDRALSLPSKDDHNDCKELLVTMGVPVVEAIAPYEAEGLASSLAKAGLVDFVGTEDSDVLAYEACHPVSSLEFR